jgi:hypothetical protein
MTETITKRFGIGQQESEARLKILEEKAKVRENRPDYANQIVAVMAPALEEEVTESARFDFQKSANRFFRKRIAP